MNNKQLFAARTYPMVATARLVDATRTVNLRCDAKQADERYRGFDKLLDQLGYTELGTFLPKPFVKGSQPDYVDGTEGVPVINTLSIQRLAINVLDCRYISDDDYDDLPDDRKLKNGDVLLTMDGGTSIGKPVLFDLSGTFTVDSHVAILRPEGISPIALVYLLASPLGQLQFQRAESGASGQTAVTEEDVRGFRFPNVASKTLEKLVTGVNKRRADIQKQRRGLDAEEQQQWDVLFQGLLKEPQQPLVK